MAPRGILYMAYNKENITMISIKEQKDTCKNYFNLIFTDKDEENKKQFCQIKKFFSDPEISSNTLLSERKGLQETIKELKTGNYGYLVVYQPQILANNGIEFGEICSILKKMKVKLYSVYEKMYHQNYDDIYATFQFQNMFAFQNSTSIFLENMYCVYTGEKFQYRKMVRNLSYISDIFDSEDIKNDRIIIVRPISTIENIYTYICQEGHTLKTDKNTIMKDLSSIKIEDSFLKPIEKNNAFLQVSQ